MYCVVNKLPQSTPGSESVSLIIHIRDISLLMVADGMANEEQPPECC